MLPNSIDSLYVIWIRIPFVTMGAIKFALNRCFPTFIVTLLFVLFDVHGLQTPASGESTLQQSLRESDHLVDEVPEQNLTLSPLRGEMYHDSWIDLNKNGVLDNYEDSSLDIDSRVDDLMSRMTVQEKTCQLATLYGYQRVLKQDLPHSSWKKKVWKDGIANIDEHLNGIPTYQNKKDSEYVWPPSKHARAINEVQKWFLEETRLGIPVDFTNEGIRGVCHQRATNFPAQVGLGATWNRDIIERVGRVSGTEAKALGYTHIYSPILDLARDPRWGRVVECYGEDPFLVAELGLAQVSGLHQGGVGATCKHFAVYGVPKGGRDGEARTDPHVAPREMEMMYLRPFEKVIQDQGIQGVMSSYNDYDGVPVSASNELLSGFLRDRFGFRGYVVSDSAAVEFLKTKHRIVPTLRLAAKRFLDAGGNVRTDFDPPDRFVKDARRLIAEGQLSLDVLDSRVRDVLRVKMELGLFDSPFVRNPEQSDKVIRCDQHRKLALKAARESIVLLKNDNQLLPLSKTVKSILVCGPNAKEKAPCISRYGPTQGEVVSIFEGVSQAVSKDTQIHYAKGCEIVDSRWPESEILPQRPNGTEEALLQKAVDTAKNVDVILVALGESEETIGESKSRTELSITGHQNELVRRLCGTGKPVVVVLMNGRALSINEIDGSVPAILEAWFPGEACGTAISDVLFGDYNPGGKLPITFPRTVGQLPLNFPFKPGSQAGQGRGDNPNGIGSSRIIDCLYPFGFGLSYTEFSYSGLMVNPAKISPGESVSVELYVTNVGRCAGDEVVQVYLRDDHASVITYDKTLCGFERVSLQPGQSERVTIKVTPDCMEILNSEMEREIEAGAFTVMAGSSSRDIRLEGSYVVEVQNGGNTQ